MSFCIASDIQAETSDRHQMRAMLMNSTKPILFGTVLVLLMLTFLLNLAGVIVRARIRARARQANG